MVVPVAQGVQFLAGSVLLPAAAHEPREQGLQLAPPRPAAQMLTAGWWARMFRARPGTAACIRCAKSDTHQTRHLG